MYKWRLGITIVLALTSLAGCSSTYKSSTHAITVHSTDRPRTTRVLADSASANGQSPSTQPRHFAPSSATTGPVAPATTTTPPTAPPTAPTTRPAYSAPSAAVRALTFSSVIGSMDTTSDIAGASRAFAESAVAPGMADGAAATGRTGLTAPQTLATSSVTGRPGLIRGSVTGLSYAARNNTIFTPMVNPLTGTNGRCRQLVNAGFFSSASACQQRFR